LCITLAENASTGYRWALDRCDAAVAELLATEPRYPAPAVGAGGAVAYTFRAGQPGRGEIALKQWRSWEGDASVTARFCIHLEVRP
jgi:inhibitor of cysteine peptidase